MNLKTKIFNSVLAGFCCLLVIAHLAIYGIGMFATELEGTLENLTNIVGYISLPVVICEIVYLSILKPKGKEVKHNIILFVALCFLSIGVFFKGLFYLISVILPSSYTLVITRFSGLFYQGIKYTLTISLIGTIVGFLIACVLGTLRTIKPSNSDKKIIKVIKVVVNYLIRLYVTVFRGTPMMVQAMIIFYGFVGIFHWEPVTAGLVIVSINTGAYFTEVVKDGIDSVDKGQMEAARSLGFSYPKSLLLIVFPQAIKNSMAAIGNEFVINIKDTSVLNVIGCAEMYYILNMSAGTNYKYMEQMIVGALIYLLLTFSTTKILELAEKKLDAPTMELRGSN